MIYLTLYNNLYIKIDSEETDVFQLINEHFSYWVEGAQYSNKYKCGIWDGKIYMFDHRNRILPYGLLFDLITLLKDNNYEISASEEVKNLFGETTDVIFNYDLKYYPRDYQKDIIESCIKYKKCLFLSATGSGKSLIISYICKILRENYLVNNCVIIVPTTSLITQFYNDMIDYGIDSSLLGKFYADEKCWDKSILISTWQSLSHDNEKIRRNETIELKKKLSKKSIKQDEKEKLLERYNLITSKEYITNVKELMKQREVLMENVDCVIVDECQTVKAQTVSELLKKFTNTKYRFGCTGTLPDQQIDIVNIKSFIGPKVKHYGVKELTEHGYLNKCVVHRYNLKYNNKIEGTLNEVKDVLFENKFRMGVINDVIRDIGRDNILILVGRIEKEGSILESNLKSEFPDKQIKFIYGKTKPDERELWRKKCIDEDNIILISSYPVFQAGINIPNLSYVMFASSYKSKVRNLQSIGRSLRRMDGKSDSCIIDIVDYNNKFLPNQANERMKFYCNEDFIVKSFTIKEKEYER